MPPLLAPLLPSLLLPCLLVLLLPPPCCCIPCPAPQHRILINSTCLCMTGYYQDSSLTCLPCSPPCLACTSAPTTCTSCLSTRVLAVSTCICAAGYYDDGNGSCLACGAGCGECVSGPGYCTACKPEQMTVLVNNTCVCGTGYYLGSNDSACYRCHAACSDCYEASQYNCTGCNVGYVLVGTYCKLYVQCTDYRYEDVCMGMCPDGTYGVVVGGYGECRSCGSGCRRCGANGLCLQCGQGWGLQVGLCGGCAVGWYWQPGLCLQCPSGCLACTNATGTLVCTACSPGLYLIVPGTCTSICPLSTTLVLARCLPCSPECLTCSGIGPQLCTACAATYYFYNGSCLKQCPLGTFSLESSPSCLPCPPSCLLCQSNLCLACLPGHYLDTLYRCTPHKFYYNQLSQLLPCHYSCLACSDDRYSSCLLCDVDRGAALYSSPLATIDGHCQCQASLYDIAGRCEHEPTLYNSNSALVSLTYSSAFFVLLIGLFNDNLLPLCIFISYLQVYSSLDFVSMYNGYGWKQVMRGYRLWWRQVDVGGWSGRLLQTRQGQRQEYFVGGEWQYLGVWGRSVLVLTGVLWVLSLGLVCCCGSRSTRALSAGQTAQSKCFHNPLLPHLLCQSLPILLFALTYSELTLYATNSFLDLTVQSIPQDNITEMALSVILVIYYLVYFLRMVVGCLCCRSVAQGRRSTLWVLFWGNQGGNRYRLSKCFVPLLFLRNALMMVLISVLHFDPIAQTISLFLLLLISFAANLCLCPYTGTPKLYLHFTQFLMAIQLSIVLYMSTVHEQAREKASGALLVFGYGQVCGAVVVALWGWGRGLAGLGARRVANESGNGSVVLQHEESLANLEEEGGQGALEKIAGQGGDVVLGQSNNAQIEQLRKSHLTKSYKPRAKKLKLPL